MISVRNEANSAKFLTFRVGSPRIFGVRRSATPENQRNTLEAKDLSLWFTDVVNPGIRDFGTPYHNVLSHKHGTLAIFVQFKQIHLL